MRLYIVLAAIMMTIGTHDVKADEIIELTQTPCQFVESEGVDHGYVTRKKADCVAQNEKTAEARLKASEPLVLKAGDYTFRVKNKNVPYELGFWLRESDYDWKNPIHKLTKLSVSGGGINPSQSRDYNVTLEPGEYRYSCPLNTTPDYVLIVQ